MKKIFKFSKINLSNFAFLKIIFLFFLLPNILLSNDVEIIFGLSYPSLRSFDDNDIFLNTLETSWKYVGIKAYYLLYKNLATEIRYSFISRNVTNICLREYVDILFIGKSKLFTGIETSYISFNEKDLKGHGYEYGIFWGNEYFLTRYIVLSLDLAYIFITLNDLIYDKIFLEDGFVINFGFSLYFSSKG
ncbi:MAG: hypothetical protein QW474_03925 [Candidatus Aenigmatarchaeota archaeon]